MSEKQFDVTALGELLVDFTQGADSAQGNPTFEANPGGAPCNVLAMLQKLGNKTAFIGRVGNDMFGRMLKRRACEQGIDMTGLEMDNEIHTTLAFVEKLPDGDRDFSFYRKPGADIMISREDVLAHKDIIASSRLFHFGTLSMTDDICEGATLEALSVARENGLIVTFDPNYRAPLWSSVEKAREKIRFGMKNCDVMKISDNEIELMTGERDIDRGVQKILDEYHIPLVLATLGPDGAKAFYRGKTVYAAPFRNPKTIETTGAGDTFCACALHFVLEYGLDQLNEEKLVHLLTFANAAASLITTRKGALAVMPSREEVEAYIHESGR